VCGRFSRDARLKVIGYERASPPVCDEREFFADVEIPRRGPLVAVDNFIGLAAAFARARDTRAMDTRYKERKMYSRIAEVTANLY